ncbi:hypothetical protein E2P81_ATG05362 [Venturia nashicola]|nr:hypothetical protein E2P81_ATG05362 [Venturia nashicola]
MSIRMPMVDLNPTIIATWPDPNYEHPNVRGPTFGIVGGLFFFCATICVWVRLYLRWFVRRWFGLDDWLILVAYLATLATTTCVNLGTSRYDWNKHLWDVKPSHYSVSLKILYVSRIFWGMAASCVRLSILCLFYRLLDVCEGPRKMRWVLHATTAVTVVLLMYFLGWGIFPCVPIKAYWAWPPLPNSHCLQDGRSMQAIAVVNTSVEVFIAILPVIATFRLQVDPRQRCSVIALLSLGFVVAIAGVIRTVFIFRLLRSNDLTWWSGPQWLVSEIEIDLALIGACAAPLRSIVVRFINRIRGVQATTLKSVQQKASHPSPSPGQGTQSSMDFDHDAVSSWQQHHSRTIDLEGIGVDGFGYSVVISGPTKRKRLRKPNPHGKKGTDLILQPGRAFQRIRSPLVSPDMEPIPMDWAKPKLALQKTKSLPLQVTTEKTFQVTESFQEGGTPSGKSSRMGSTSLPGEPTLGEAIEQAANLAGWEIGQFSEAYGEYVDHFKPEPPPKQEPRKEERMACMSKSNV